MIKLKDLLFEDRIPGIYRRGDKVRVADPDSDRYKQKGRVIEIKRLPYGAKIVVKFEDGNVEEFDPRELNQKYFR